MKPIAVLMISALAAMAQQAKIPWTDSEKPILSRIQKLRSLPEDQRPIETRKLALEIRRLPLSPGKDSLAIDLANLVTEGDPGHETLQETATTLANALRDQPSSSGDPYFVLAQLVRYEHVDVSLDDARFRDAMKTLEADDARRDNLDFTLTSLDGKSWTLRQLKGKVVVVNFWATWCPPCRKEMPDLDAISQEFRSKGLVILGITDEDRATVDRFYKEHPVGYQILLDPGRHVNDRFVIRGIPKTFVYDRSGRLAAESIDMRTKAQFMQILRKAGL